MTPVVDTEYPAGRGRVLQLFCFAHAGGSAEMFRQWQPLLPQGVVVRPVELPGRGKRFCDPFSPSLDTAATEAAVTMAPLTAQGGYAIFGHSLGSVMALEVARHLESMGRPPARALIVSGRVPPHVARREAPLHTADDEALLAEVRRLGGTPDEVLRDEQFIEYLLPIVRNDFRLLETHPPHPVPRVSCPVHVCCGDADTDAPTNQLARWAEVCQGPCTIRMFHGGHFYIHDERRSLTRYIGEVVQNAPEQVTTA